MGMSLIQNLALNHSIGGIEINDNILNEVKSKGLLSHFDYKSVSRKVNSSMLGQIPDSLKAHLTSRQLSFIDDIDNALYSGKDMSGVLADFDLLIARVKKEFSPKEGEVLLGGLFIGKYSIVYWKENIKKWNKVFSQGVNGNGGTCARDWQDYAQADIRGGMEAGAQTVLVSFLAPVCPGGALAAVLVGGACASAIYGWGA